MDATTVASAALTTSQLRPGDGWGERVNTAFGHIECVFRTHSRRCFISSDWCNHLSQNVIIIMDSPHFKKILDGFIMPSVLRLFHEVKSMSYLYTAKHAVTRKCINLIELFHGIPKIYNIHVFTSNTVGLFTSCRRTDLRVGKFEQGNPSAKLHTVTRLYGSCLVLPRDGETPNSFRAA